MNLSKLGFSGWIIALNVFLLVLLVLLLVQLSHVRTKEAFLNLPQQVDPDAPIKKDPAVDAANMNYTALLAFVKENPLKSGRFIQDIRQKFFADTCAVKNYIDFNNIISLPNGPVFT